MSLAMSPIYHPQPSTKCPSLLSPLRPSRLPSERRSGDPQPASSLTGAMLPCAASADGGGWKGRNRVRPLRTLEPFCEPAIRAGGVELALRVASIICGSAPLPDGSEAARGKRLKTAAKAQKCRSKLECAPSAQRLIAVREPSLCRSASGGGGLPTA